MFSKKSILFFCFLLLNTIIFSQTRKQLERERKKLRAEISTVNKLLFKTKEKEKNALDALKDLNQKVDIRTKLIETIHLETTLLSKKINENQDKLAELNKKLTVLKTAYAEMIFKSYKSKSQQSRIMFLLSSKNFYQAYKRLEYMKQYTSYRKKQGEKIGIQKNRIQKITDSLLFQKQVKDTLISIEKEQKEKIETDMKNQKNLVTKIKKEEKKYSRQLKKKLNDERKVKEKIDRIIREAIAKSNKEREKGLKKSSKFILSPKAKALAAKFEQNKGTLPWPVKSGLITRKFGKQLHPTIGGITINSTGLHIVTEEGEQANSIFNGKVLAIQLTSEGRKAVLVQHGNYISAYNNLETTFVKTGDEVLTGEKLGTIFTDKVTGKTKLIFVLFKDTNRLNPSNWILKR